MKCMTCEYERVCDKKVHLGSYYAMLEHCSYYREYLGVGPCCKNCSRPVRTTEGRVCQIGGWSFKQNTTLKNLNDHYEFNPEMMKCNFWEGKK
jgi:hypothetical protein